MKNTYFLFLLVVVMGCKGEAQQKKVTVKKGYPINKTDAEWKEELSEMAYYVLRRAGTERAFTGKLNKIYDPGTYVCAACNIPLYASENKYDSRSGWPSFDRGFDKNLEYDVDYKLGYARTELKCNNCGGHLGHMFMDGPRKTTGERHCINSAALNFIPSNE